MALDHTATYTQNESVTTGVYTDTTTYGGAEDDRNERGNYLLVSQNDKDGNRTYLTIANTTPLSTLTWTITNEADGWFQATKLSVKIWSSGASYVVGATPSVVYYGNTGLFYRCIQAHTNVAPDSGSGSSYWTAITDFTTIQTGYSNLDVFDFNFLIRPRTDLAIADLFDQLIDQDFAGNLTLDEASHPLNIVGMMYGAETKEATDLCDEAVQILDSITDALAD